MKGGPVKVVGIESKTFEFTVVGSYEDILQISEKGRGRSFSIFLPEPVAMWLLRAWGRFRCSKSSTWCNQMRLLSRLYMLEFKSNGAGKFLKLSVSKEGNRAFVIFPAGWKNKGWDQVFDSIAGILGKSSSMPAVQRKGKGNQSFKSRSGLVDAPHSPPPPPPPLGCCPQCGFKGAPACFLRSFANVLSPSPSSKDSLEFSHGGPSYSAEKQGNVEIFGCSQKTQQNRVYARRRVEEPIKAVNVEGSIKSVGEAEEAANGVPDASLVLLASNSTSPAYAEVSSLDPARLEAEIVSQLYFGSSAPSTGVGSVVPVVRDRQVRSSLSPSVTSASPLFSSNVVPTQISRCNNMLDHSTSMVVNPAILSVGSQYSLPADLELGVYGSVPCDLPREVVRDALAVNLGARCGATVSGQGLSVFEPSENVRPLVSATQANGEDDVTPLAVDFSFLQSV